ncbi:2-polyprenyl-6-methoxyphenol hydroxylase-like FAD-dependent oxidoreductase [Rhodoligotrophos appendicifer]|uniref:FAD-dependent monooxygenase n=1 Tax=Rhodoligotrophos appendicifer TaxID=987056 RepID=UPI001FE6A319|nr:FAD-dependent monooxygenase [Rhodoligotrophos appendicifer]
MTAKILVVGAGPVGLTMAAELARHGVDARIIDKALSPLPYCRAIGITPRTLEVWDDMGMVLDAIDAGLWLTGLRTIIDGKRMPDQHRDLGDQPYAELGLPQYETERVLTRHLKLFGIVSERGVGLDSITDKGMGAAVRLRHADGLVEDAEFDFVIGCDGAHSTVRHLAGIDFDGDAFASEFMLGDVFIDWDVPPGTAVFSINPKQDAAPDLFVAIPLPERGRYRVSMVAPDDGLHDASSGLEHGIQSEREPPSLQALQAVADRLLPGAPGLSDLRWSSIFRISMRLAREYRRGCLFLAGDAAHIHPPTGGQGMNTGIQDAYNLAWKLALVVRGKAPLDLLDSYEAERRPIGADVVARTKAASQGLGRTEHKDRLADTQLLVTYRDTAWVRDDTSGSSGPAAGDRAPDVGGLTRFGVAAPLRLFDILRGPSHVLLIRLLDWGQQAEIEAFANRLSEQRGDLLRAAVIAPKGDGPANFFGIPLLCDANGAFAATYGASSYLIRPDGYVGWKGAVWAGEGLQTYLRKIFL